MGLRGRSQPRLSRQDLENRIVSMIRHCRRVKGDIHTRNHGPRNGIDLEQTKRIGLADASTDLPRLVHASSHDYRDRLHQV